MALPYYDLRCAACQTAFSIKATVKDRTDKSISCPDCGARDLETIYRKVHILRYKNKDCDVCPGSSAFSGGCRGGACPAGRV